MDVDYLTVGDLDMQGGVGGRGAMRRFSISNNFNIRTRDVQRQRQRRLAKQKRGGLGWYQATMTMKMKHLLN